MIEYPSTEGNVNFYFLNAIWIPFRVVTFPFPFFGISLQEAILSNSNTSFTGLGQVALAVIFKGYVQWSCSQCNFSHFYIWVSLANWTNLWHAHPWSHVLLISLSDDVIVATSFKVVSNQIHSDTLSHSENESACLVHYKPSHHPACSFFKDKSFSRVGSKSDSVGCTGLYPGTVKLNEGRHKLSSF